MTDKEKIRAEIERLIVPTSRDLTFADSISNRTLQKVLKIIDHIPDNEDSDDLETFARSAVFNHPHQFDLKSEFGIDADIELYTPDDMFEAVIKGAHWQHEQMMKNAVMETTVMVDCDGDGIETPYEEWLTLENTEIPSLPENIDLKDGDKVKIIIIKENEE